MFDLILRGGTIIDGSRAPRYQADLGIRDGRIAAIGDLQDAAADELIDVSGQVVAPGFIDVHTHSDGWLIKQKHLVPKTMQGFTTEVLMADGISYAPVNQNTARQWNFYLHALNALRMDEYQGWSSVGEFMQCLDRRNVQNVATHVPYANVRSMAAGFGRQRLDDFQLRQIRDEIHQAMSQGAVGLSTGLDYIAQCFATTDELVDACRAIVEYDGLYVTHVRYKIGLLPALREAVEIGQRAGVKVHISHLKAQTLQQIEEVLQYIDTEARHKVDFSFDVYPYQHGSTMLNFLLPYEVWEDGPLAAMGKIQQEDLRARFAAGLKAYRRNLDQIRIAWVPSKENACHQGKLLSQYVDETQKPPQEALADLLLEERLAVLLVIDEGSDEQIYPLLAHDLFMMGTDGIYHPESMIHPRMYGSAARVLGPCVRERKLFSLEDAVYKLSGHAAQRFGLVGRGEIALGMCADLVVFDPQTITDQATYGNPQQHSSGVRDVLVSGEPIIREGVPVDRFGTNYPGRFLRYRQETG